MKLRIFLAILLVIVVFGGLAAVKALQIKAMIEAGEAFVPPPVAVHFAQAQTDSWQSALTSVGTVTSVRGVIVRAEVAGVVEQIAFEPGGRIGKGAVLVRLEQSVEAANLKQAEADLDLARRSLKRSERLFKSDTVSESDLDAAVAAEAAAEARVASLQATLAKKTIKTPFGGSLGIKRISVGQYLNPGDSIVDLQQMDPIFVEFSLPQREIQRLESGQTVRAQVDGFDQAFEGTITAIDPSVDNATRNLRVQATVRNPDRVLRAGMYTRVAVELPQRRDVVVVPATAVLYAPFGNTIFVVTEEKAEDGSTRQIVKQQIVRLGDTQGDFVEIVGGLTGSETIVSAGAFKLRNGQTVVNSDLGLIEPSRTPTPPDS